MQRTKIKNLAKKQSHSGSGFVRIIAGKWRGKKLPVKNIEGLRPTTDRVKETLFNWLQQDLYNAHCLDLFSGSGSLGLEALSRQAEHVTFIEKDAEAHRQLLENIATLKIDNATLYHTDAFNFLLNDNNQMKPYDLVFIDPPFHKDLLKTVCDKLAQGKLLADNALIYIETELETVQIPIGWALIKEKKAGQVYFRLYRKER